MSVVMRRALKLVTIVGALLLSIHPAGAVVDICDPLPGERPEEFTAKDICGVYEKAGTSTWGNLFARVVGGGTELRRSHALVIGVGDYDHWRSLEAPLGDAKRVRDFLIDEAGFDLVVTLTNARATKLRIEGLMEEFFPNRVAEDDRFLFYFSGHGTQRPLAGRKRGYLVLQPASEEGWAAMIGMNDVEDWAENLSEARQSLFVLDACFSGLAGTQVKGALRDKTIDRLAQYGHHLVTAGTEDEQSIAVGGASLFTTAFIRAASGLGDGETPDQPADGIVSLKELAEYISRYLDAELARLRGRYRMTPQITELQYDSVGEFFFLAAPREPQSTGPSEQATAGAAPEATKGRTSAVARLEPEPELLGFGGAMPPAGAQPGAPGGTQTEVVFWQSIEDSQDPNDFRVYLERFPDGMFTPLARNQLRRLELASPEAALREKGEPAASGQWMVSFRNGEGGYTGTQDSYLREHDAPSVSGDHHSVIVDADDPKGSGRRVHALLRFDDIFGGGLSQIPLGSTIESAALTLNTLDLGDGAAFHRMLSAWDEGSTWASMGDGLAADGVEAEISADLSTGLVAVGMRDFDVTASVQAWSGGVANRGWALLPLGRNGWDFYSREHETVASRPKLTVTFTPKPRPDDLIRLQ